MKKKKKTKNSSTSSRLTDSDFHVAVTKIAVAQICHSVGYRGTQTTALETLTDVTIRFLQSIGSSAVTVANSTGRTQSNLHDVIVALQNMYHDVGFIGNSNVTKRVTDSSILRDTMKFVYRNREIPFAKPLPRRCSTVTSYPPWFSGECGHIPPWLPDFPKIEEAIVTDSKIERSIDSIKSNAGIKISELPEKRKKVRFTIIGRGGGGGGLRNEIENGYGVDLRARVCKGGKRISFQMYDDDIDDDDDEMLLIKKKCE